MKTLSERWEWLGGSPGALEVVWWPTWRDGSGREILPEHQEWLGGSPEALESARVALLEGLEVLPMVWEWS